MKKEIVIIVVLTILLNFSLFNAIGEGDSLKVVLSVRPLDDSYPYYLNDEVVVEVRVFDKGQLTDSDTPPQVTLNKNGPNPREMSVTKSDTGFYTGTFYILESDFEDDPYFEIEAYATLSKDNEIDLFYDDSSMRATLMVNRNITSNINIEIDDEYSKFIERSPGDVLSINVTIENNNIAVDPDIFKLTADDEPISYSNPDVGVYKASYPVNPSLKEDTIIFIVAEAEYKDEFITTYNEIRVNFFTVWYHEIEVSETSADFELHVSDMNGKVVEDADINLDYNSYDDSGSISGTTDSQGKATFTIEYSNSNNIYVDGSVEKSGKIQNIDGTIYINDGRGPSKYQKFWVDPQTDTKDVQPGDTVTLEYIGYNELEPLDDQIIYFYIYDPERLIDSGSTVTDSVGNFVINVAIPEDARSITLDFESPFEPEELGEVWGMDSDDNLSYKEDYDYIIFWNMIYDDDIQITTKSFNIHDISTISARTSGSYYTIPYVYVIPGKYSFEEDSMELPRFDWEQWPGEYGASFFLFYNKEEDNFCREFLLPEYLPKDEPYTVIVFFKESSVDIHWNYVHMTPGHSNEELGEEPDNGFSNLFINDSGSPGIALVMGLILFFTMLIYIGLKKKKQK